MPENKANQPQKNEKVEWRKGVCGICPAGCWVDVALNDGKLVDIRQDNDNTLGAICLRGKYAPDIIYSPHRLQYPMKRIGPKGTYEFERISWNKAYGIIVERLNTIKRESGPEAVTIYTGRGAQELSLCDMFQPKDVIVSSASNILFPFGSPNTTGVGALCYVSLHMIAPHTTMGRIQTNMFTDIENAEMVIVWGTNPATDSPPADIQRIEAAAARGAEVFVIDPRRTETVYRTNAGWIPIRPGTDGALALGIIEVMIEEDLYDEDFADNWTFGFEELKTYVQHFRPEVVQEITRIPAETIRNLARKLCGTTGVSLLMYTGLEYSNTGVQSARAVLTAFALAGQLDVPGGIGLSMLNNEFPINRSCNLPNPDLDRAIGRKEFPVYSDYRGESHAISLVDSVLKGEPYKTRALLIDGASLLTSWPQTSIWRKVLSELDFLVTIDRQMTADAAYADLVLPATTMFENLSYMVYGPVFRVRERIIEPYGEARNDYLIMTELARRLGYGDLFPPNEEEMIRFALDGSGYTLEDVRQAGGWVRLPTPMMEYKKWQKGGLRNDGKSGFDTPTGKFEIWSTILEGYGYEPLPKYIEPKESPVSQPGLLKEYPLVFNSGARPMNDFRSQHHGIDGLVKTTPEPIVEINHEDAAERGIGESDLVRVKTLRGATFFRARVTENIMKGAIECNMGGGTPVGPKAWQEWNVNELTDLSNFDEISGFPVYKVLLCDIEKVESRTGLIPDIPESGSQLETFGQNIEKVDYSKFTRMVYLDNNATTPVADEVREVMTPFLGIEHGNPSSIYKVGQNAKSAVDRARRQIASLINVQSRRIIFTSGGSEADNMAIKGMAFSAGDKGNHIITSTIEHPAVLNTCRFLEHNGFIFTYLDVDEYGLVNAEDLKKAITEKTILVSIMAANNEVGTVQHIKELCDITHEKKVLFHTDAVQAIGKIKIDVKDTGVDMLSISAHKFHGPKGVGALYVRKGIDLEPLIHGGKQESGFRAGTENVASIVGMGKAAEMAQYSLGKMEKVRELRNRLYQAVRSLIPGAILNGHPEERLPNTLNLTLPGMRGESIVIALDHYGIALSSGSACKSGLPEPTHVLIAMGRTEEEAHCSVRFSLSRYNTEEDITQTVAALEQVLKDKEIVRLMPCK